MRLATVIDGIPIPQGSMRIVGRGRMTSDNPRLHKWRKTVADQARQAIDGQPLMDGPIVLEVDFYLPRPNGHWGTGRNASVLRPSAPAHPSTKPDLDKLIRAIGDALTGVWLIDDARIVCVHATKHWADRQSGPGAYICAYQIEEDQA